MNTAVLLLIFRRSDLTSRAIEQIATAMPPRLYVAGDGPRAGRRGERTATEATRRLVLDRIDWDCEVKTLFRQGNLGARRAVPSAIDWFFEHEEQGIIIEDDCVADPSFFPYCEELLDRYRDEQRVMHIGGNCFLSDLELDYSYFFSTYPARLGMGHLEECLGPLLLVQPRLRFRIRTDPAVLFDPEGGGILVRHLRQVLRTASSRPGTTAGRFRSGAPAAFRCTRPGNLVKNIGFGAGAANTKAWKDYKGLGRLPLESLGELNHPGEIGRNSGSRRRELHRRLRPSTVSEAGLRRGQGLAGRETGCERLCPIRVLIVNNFARITGGADLHCLELTDGLRERGHEVRWLATRSDENLENAGAFVPPCGCGQPGSPRTRDRLRAARWALWNPHAAG